MTIYANLSAIANGLKDPKEILGKPVTLNGQEIGKIIDINQEKDIFFAEITTDVDTASALLELNI